MSDRFHTCKILIIDGDEGRGTGIQWALKDLGYAAHVATNAEAAIIDGAHFRPNVVLLDVGPPLTNGYALCKRLRKETVLKDAVFIAQTGWDNNERLLPTAVHKVDYHLLKPFKIDELVGLIEKLDL